MFGLLRCCQKYMRNKENTWWHKLKTPSSPQTVLYFLFHFLFYFAHFDSSAQSLIQHNYEPSFGRLLSNASLPLHRHHQCRFCRIQTKGRPLWTKWIRIKTSHCYIMSPFIDTSCINRRGPRLSKMSWFFIPPKTSSTESFKGRWPRGAIRGQKMLRIFSRQRHELYLWKVNLIRIQNIMMNSKKSSWRP